MSRTASSKMSVYVAGLFKQELAFTAALKADWGVYTTAPLNPTGKTCQATLKGVVTNIQLTPELADSEVHSVHWWDTNRRKFVACVDKKTGIVVIYRRNQS